MPRLQAIVRPLAGKSQLRSPNPQGDRTTAAPYFRIFSFKFTLKSTSLRQPHEAAKKRTQIAEAAGSQAHTNACK